MSNESIIFLVGTIILAGVTLFLCIKYFYARGKVRTVIGTIADIGETAGKHFASQCVALVNYTIDGKNYTSKNRIGVVRGSKVGEEVEVKYFIDEPELLFTTKFAQVVGFFVATVVCLGIFIFLY